MKTKRVFCDSLRRWGIGVMAAAMLVACEKPIIDDDSGGGEVPTEANVVLRFTQYETSPLTPLPEARRTTRAATDITELCSRLNIAIFDGDGTNYNNLPAPTCIHKIA